MQVESALSKNLDESGYLKMIGDKTSSLISASTLIGAITATKEQDKRDSLFRYGEKLGTMFQIKDDLLDITGLEREIGKPTMFDLKKNMLTLPLIYILSNQEELNQKQFLSDLKYLSKKNRKREIKSMIIDMGGVEYAEKKIEELSDAAIDDLKLFDDSETKNALISAIHFNMNRKM